MKKKTKKNKEKQRKTKKNNNNNNNNSNNNNNNNRNDNNNNNNDNNAINDDNNNNNNPINKWYDTGSSLMFTSPNTVLLLRNNPCLYIHHQFYTSWFINPRNIMVVSVVSPINPRIHKVIFSYLQLWPFISYKY